MIIYKITNRINGKIYIGQTRSTIKKRFSQHCETRNKTAIGLAIKKYGSDNFEYAILYDNIETLKELNKKEIECIKLYNSISPNGYNIESGGKVIFANKETREKISKALKGREIKWANKVSISVKRLWENEEYHNKMIKAHSHKIGKYKKHTKPLRLDLPIEEINELYRNGITINKIAKTYNVSFTTIKKRISK